MTDVLLIQPPVRDFYLTAKRTIPYGLACIAAALQAKGFSVQILDALATTKSRVVDLPADMQYLGAYYGRPDRSPFGLFHQYRHFGYSFAYLGRAAKSSGAFLVGISALFTPYIDEALALAESVKQHHPRAKIVLGGHHPSALPASVIQHPAVDFVLRGEGEVSLPLLARAIHTGADVAAIPGIVWRTKDGGVHCQKPAVMDNLDRFPLPAVELICNDFYKRKTAASSVVTASRGCPLACSYCAVGAASFMGYRRRSVAGVMAELEVAVARMGARFVDFEDENLSWDKKWFRKLLEKIRERFQGSGLELRAMNGLLPTTLDDDLVAAMQAAGFKTLNLSLGATSAAQLKRFNRPDVRKAFDHALALAEKYRLTAVGYIIIGAPFQQARDSLSDLLFLAGRRVLAGVSVFYPCPESSDYRQCENQRLLPARFALMRSSALPISHTTSRQQVVTLLRLGRLVNFMKRLAEQSPGAAAPALAKSGASWPDGRVRTGARLLEMFLNDGQIRGITPEGEIYAHQIDTVLARAFLEGLQHTPIRGVN